MRDPTRIYSFCNKLAYIWMNECPDWRFGQLIFNIFDSMDSDPFHIEDDEMLHKMLEYFGIIDNIEEKGDNKNNVERRSRHTETNKKRQKTKSNSAQTKNKTQTKNRNN